MFTSIDTIKSHQKGWGCHWLWESLVHSIVFGLYFQTTDFTAYVLSFLFPTFPRPDTVILIKLLMFSVFGYIWCLLQVPKSFLLQILGKDRVTKFLIEEIVSITVGDFVKKVCPFSFISYYISSQCLNLENYLNLLSLSGKFEGEEPIQDNTNCRWAWISIYPW